MKQIKRTINRFAVLITAAILLVTVLPFAVSAAGTSKEKVRVGYYENEVFQEGAKEGSVKTGYAYEYYQKLSEYTGWRYEYVYGEFGDLYQMLLDGKIDFLAGLAFREDRKDLIGYPDAACDGPGAGKVFAGTFNKCRDREIPRLRTAFCSVRQA